MELFRQRARVVTYKDGLFLEPSWLAVYFGQRVMPDCIGSARRCAADSAEVARQLQAVREQVHVAVVRMPHARRIPRAGIAPRQTVADLARSTTVNGTISHGRRRRRCRLAWLAAAGAAPRVSQSRARSASWSIPACRPMRRVGRWTLPSQRGMHGLLGITESDLMRRTGATFKLASEHRGWQGEGSRFLHAHGEIGTDIAARLSTSTCCCRPSTGASTTPENYSVAARGRATRDALRGPMGEGEALTSSFTYGFHLDEAAYVAFLAAHAAQLGVRRVTGTLASVTRLPDGEMASAAPGKW